MATTSNHIQSAIQPRHFSQGKTANMHGRTDLLASRNNFYKRMYGNTSRNAGMNIYEQFVRACENGDYTTVHRILEDNPKFSIDVTDQLGRTAMQLAIENEHLEVVTLLLAQCDGQKMREALLLAIYLGHVQIAEVCLRHPKFIVLNEKRAFNANEETFWQTPSSDDAQFPPDVTPLILAAQYNRTEIVQILLQGGDRITKPHDYHCKCLQCHNKFKFDSLRHAQSRLNAYRGLASESYISIASLDPIVTAFELGRELRDLSGKEKYFKNEYMILADQLSLYAVKLLDKVRGHKELECVLGKTGKESEEKHDLLARLYLAIKYEEKPFVAHSNCQQKLVEIWQSQIRNLFKLHRLIILLLITLYIFALPFACIIYILFSWSKYAIKFQRFLKQPCIKFIGHTISYGIFIVLIIASSFLFANEFQKPLESLKANYSNLALALNQSIEQKINQTRKDCIIYPNDNFVFRAARPTGIDIAISVFVIGFLWREIKQAYNDGIRDYLISWNNIIDSCMTIAYVASFALKYYVIIQVIQCTKTLKDDEFQSNLTNICDLSRDEQLKIYHTFYWLNADRFYWVPCDPVNVAEGLFAVANIFSFSRICFLLPAFQHLGPLQISLGRMMADIAKFSIIFLFIFCGFMFGLNNLFWYYKQSVRGVVEIRAHPGDGDLPAEEFFGTMSSTFKTVFWSLFGLAEKEGVQLEHFNNQFTETFGYLIYGAFNITSVIVLLNMLIAMMSKSYETIEEHADVEWKFARSKLYMEYIKEGGTLPVPFNIVPTPKSIYYLFRRIFACVKRITNPAEEQSVTNDTNNSLPPMIRPSGGIVLRRPRFNPNAILTVSTGMLNENMNYRARQGSFDINQILTYRKVIKRVVKRFLLHKQRKEQEEIREGDFEELKQDIQMLRFELLNRMDETRQDLDKNSHLLNEGVIFVGELLSKLLDDTSPIVKENFHLFKKGFYSRTDSGIESNTSTITTTSMPHLFQQLHTSIFQSNQQDSDIDPINVMKPLTAVHVTLSNITEEDDENVLNSSKYNDEEEVEARHMSVQTSADDDDVFLSKF